MLRVSGSGSKATGLKLVARGFPQPGSSRQPRVIPLTIATRMKLTTLGGDDTHRPRERPPGAHLEYESRLRHPPLAGPPGRPSRAARRQRSLERPQDTADQL
jgi:hypothetical protein